MLAGPTGDPAGRRGERRAQHRPGVRRRRDRGDQRRQRATFVSRGGQPPGTTVEEHQIWALVDSSGLAPAGLLLCDVSAADGGGETPDQPARRHRIGQPCPDGGALPSGRRSAWYVDTGYPGQERHRTRTPAPAAPAAPTPATCSPTAARSTTSPPEPTRPGAIPNLEIVTRDNSASAPGGANALINYFHAYIINPSKPGETVNLTAAQDFVNLLTSPAFQSQLKVYLAHTTIPAARRSSPTRRRHHRIRASRTTYQRRQAGDGHGHRTNAEPGYPALAGKTVSIDEIEAGCRCPSASGKTDSTGDYSITFTPTSTGSYEVSTAQISQIENAR